MREQVRAIMGAALRVPLVAHGLSDLKALVDAGCKVRARLPRRRLRPL